MPIRSIALASASALFAGLLAACGGQDAPADDAAAVDATPIPPPTIVARIPRTPTPTAVDPLAVVPSAAIEGIVVPAGAELVDEAAATDDTDARADYRIEGVDAAELSEWFGAHMPDAGWGEPEERDGALVFIHTTQLSARHATVGQKRTATVFFGLEEGADFTLLVEAAKP